MECGELAVANLPDTQHADLFRFPVHGTFAGTLPQLTTTAERPRLGHLVDRDDASDKLLAAPLLLPGRVVTVTKCSGGRRVTLTGPESCLPPVDLGLGLRASGGTAASKILKLNGTTLHSTTLHGASLKPGKSYTLTGTVRFSGGPTITATIRFRACPK